MNRISLLFARRYFASPRSLSVVNIISRVSVFAIGIPVAAMVILLSVFNGFDSMVKKMYGVFDPDLLVVPAHGKVFDVDSVAVRLSQFNSLEYSFLLEENVLLEYRGQQSAALLRGVDSCYVEVVPIEESISRGQFQLQFGDMQQAVVGQGIAYDLGIRTAFYDPLNIYAVRRGDFSSLLPIDAYNKDFLFPAGVFRLDAETDATYVLSSLEFAQQLLDYQNMASAVAVKVLDGRHDNMRTKLQSSLGSNFNVLSRYQQKASMYRIMKLEKLGIFIISLFVLIIASFSIIGSLVMLIIDKRPDINILYTMGASTDFVRNIFVCEGMLISLIGTLSGLLFGLLLALLQQHFGFIKINAATFLVDAYPVNVHFFDVVMIAAASLLVTWIINIFTVSKMIPRSSIRL